MSRRSDEAEFYKERERRIREERADAERRRNTIHHPEVPQPAPLGVETDDAGEHEDN